MADIELDANPESTWGATDPYKEAWNAKYGNVSPSPGAVKADWVAFVVKNGKTEEEAESMTVKDMVAEFGAETLYVSPSVPNAEIPGQGAGTSASVSAAPVVTATGTNAGAGTGTATGTR